MYLIKIKAVNRLFKELDKEISSFTKISGIQCKAGCGKCCLKSDLKTTVLEFLPAAYRLFSSGEYQDVLDRLKKDDQQICVFYNPFMDTGKCSVYHDRALICRLYGFSGRIDKNENRSLITCNIIKENHPAAMNPVLAGLAPNMSSYYMRLLGIDPDLSIKYLPINEAIEQAIEIIAFYSGFRNKSA